MSNLEADNALTELISSFGNICEIDWLFIQLTHICLYSMDVGLLSHY